MGGTSATFSGTIASTVTNALVLSNNTSTTQYVYTSLANSVGNARYGVDNSSGGGLGTGTSANSAVFGNAGNADVDITTNNISRLKITSTGAATFSSSVTTGGNINLNTNNGILYLNNTGGGTNYGYIQGSSGLMNIQVASGGDINFGNGSDLVRIKASGNVGIGTTSPTGTYGKLTVAGGIQILDDNNAKLEIGRYSAGASNSYIKLGTNSNSLIFTNAADTADLVTFTNSGSVGIGITSPSKLFTVRSLDNNTTTFAGFYALNETQGTEIWYGGIQMGGSNAGVDLNLASKSTGYISLQTSGSERMRIKGDGDILVSTGAIHLRQTVGGTVDNNSQSIGNNGVNYMNRVSGTGLSHILFNNGGNIVGSITSNATNTQYNTSSDYRLKEDLKDFNALDLLSNIKLYDFAWKLNQSRMYGVLAHELKQYIPYSVVGEKDELDENGKIKPQGVDYSLLTPILAKAIQELQSQINELKNN